MAKAKKIYGGYLRETMAQAGYTYGFFDNGYHYLKNNTTKQYEVFMSNKYFAGWAILYKNTSLEFCHSQIFKAV